MKLEKCTIHQVAESTLKTPLHGMEAELLEIIVGVAVMNCAFHSNFSLSSFSLAIPANKGEEIVLYM